MENLHLSLDLMRVRMTQISPTSVQRPLHEISWRKREGLAISGALKQSPSQTQTPKRPTNILIQRKESQMKGDLRFLSQAKFLRRN